MPIYRVHAISGRKSCLAIRSAGPHGRGSSLRRLELRSACPEPATSAKDALCAAILVKVMPVTSKDAWGAR